MGDPNTGSELTLKEKNDISLGVCFIGRTKFTIKQYISLEKILKKWKSLYPKATIVGHCDTGILIKLVQILM